MFGRVFEERPFLPGLSTDNLNLTEVPIQELSTETLLPGAVITGMQCMKDFTTLERLTCASLTNAPVGVESTGVFMERFSLGSQLWASRISRPIVGAALCFPLDAPRVASQPNCPPVLRPTQEQAGLTFLMMLGVWTLRNTSNEAVTEISYYPVPLPQDPMARIFTGRVIKPGFADVLASKCEEPEGRAERLAAYAMRRIYPPTSA